MNDVSMLICTAVAYLAGVGIGYFSCMYRNQHVIQRGRAAIEKETCNN